MARAPSRPAREAELLRPAASPIDSYVRPEPSGLGQIAEALGSFDRPLNAFMEQRAQKQREVDEARGEAAFYQNNAEGYAEAVQKGLIPAQASRTFVRAYKRAQGSVAGVRLQGEFSSAYDAWEGKNSEDPAEFERFFADFVRTRVGTDDPDVLGGLLPAVRQLTGAAGARHTQYRHEQTYNGSLTAHMAGVNQAIDAGDEAGLLSPEGTDYPAVFAAIGQKREEFVASGGKPEDFDKAMMDGVAAKALSLRDPGLLSWFDQKVPGQDYSYGDTPYGRDLKNQTVASMEVAGRQAASDEYTRQQRENEAAKDTATRQAIDLLAAGQEIPDELLAAGQRVDPTFRTRITEWRKSLSDRSSDPDALMSVYDAILRGDGMQAVVQAFNAGVIANPEDLSKLHTFAKGFEENGDRIGDALGSASARSLLDAFDVQTKGSNTIGDPVGGISREGLEAQYDFRRMVTEWTIANPNATTYEREEAVGRFGKIILDRIQPSDNPLAAGGTYERGDEPFSNPYTQDRPAAAAPAPAQAPTSEQEGSTWYDPRTWFGGEEEAQAPSDAQWLEGLTPEQRSAVQTYAGQSGLSIEEAGRIIRQRTDPSYKPVSAVGDGGATFQNMAYDPNFQDTPAADTRAGALTPEQASAFLDEALAANEVDTAPGSAFVANDPSASRLLNLIGQHEAAGNYNAVYGKAGSKRDLSALTLDQILGEQQAARRRGVASTAIGRYQFIYKTLRGLKDELGLTGKERFTPELQDRLGMQLLERRGYSAFRQGRISQRQFALRLSQEWASLANPNTGRSFYAGDGLNASSASASDVYRALGLAI